MADARAGRIPDFFIIGAPRCGTTFLYSALRAQPGVFMPERKEPHYFAADADGGSPEEGHQRVRDREQYLRLFSPAATTDLLGEASTDYLLSRVAVPAILDANPRARLIVSLRDPIEQIASTHGRLRAAGVEQLDLETALRHEEDRRTWKRPTRVPLLGGSPPYRAAARYGEQLERLFAVLPRDQVLVMKLDDIAADAAVALRRVTQFLGIPDPLPVAGPERNGSRAARSQRLLEAVWSPGFIRAAKRAVPTSVHPLARRLAAQAQAWNRRAAPRPDVSPTLRDELRDELRPDLELASRLLGEDLVSRWWGAAT